MHCLQSDAAKRGDGTRLASMDRGQRQQTLNLAEINRRLGDPAKPCRVIIRAERGARAAIANLVRVVAPVPGKHRQINYLSIIHGLIFKIRCVDVPKLQELSCYM